MPLNEESERIQDAHSPSDKLLASEGRSRGGDVGIQKAVRSREVGKGHGFWGEVKSLERMR